MAYERVVERDCAIVRAWIRRQVYGSGFVPPYKRDNQIVDDTGHARERGAHIYSYGRHFTIAEVWRPRGRRPLIILNGERWPGGGFSSRTGDHQSAARDVAGELAASGAADVLILPLAALAAAAIDHGSIRPLQQLDDQWILHERPIGIDLDDLAAATCRPFADRNASAYYSRGAGARFTWSDGARVYVRELRRDKPRAENLETYATDGARRMWADLSASSPAEWIASGAGWMSASAQSENLSGRDRRDIERRGDGWYETWTEHRLGESLFTARAGNVKRRRRFVSSFDYQERVPLYFLAELPASSTARTVAAAIEDLAPRAVHAAMARDIPVYRQGDMFAIETALTDAEIYGRAVSRARLAPFQGNGKIRAGEIGYLAPKRRRALIEARYRELRSIGGRSQKPARPPRKRPSGIAPAPAHIVASAERETAERAARAIEARRNRRAAGRISQCGAGEAMRRAIRSAVPFEVRYAASRAAVDCPWSAVPPEYRPAVLELYRYARMVAPATLELASKPRYPAPDRYSALRRLQEWPAAELKRVQVNRRGRRDAARAISGRPSASDCYWRAVLDVQTMDRRAVARALTFYGTAHTAREVVKVKGGAIYARGRISHATELETVLDGRGGSRAPDHRPIKLGDGQTWFLIVRNTVPRAR